MTRPFVPALIFLAAVWAAASAGADDAGPDAGPDSGDTDTGGPPEDCCEEVDDPCCIDDGTDEEVAELSGCNGPPMGPASTGNTGGECTYDPDLSPEFGNCGGIDACWPYPHWYTGYPSPTGGECGLCLPRCANIPSCPDGINEPFDTEGTFTYDFATSDCPEGMRCWVYQYFSVVVGLCIMDCADDEDCSSGICDPAWNVCVPRPESCEEPDTDEDAGADTDVDTTTSDVDEPGGSKEGDAGGCACSSVGASKGASLLDLLVGSLSRRASWRPLPSSGT